MRLDKFLKVSRLIKRRTVANEACDAGRVLVNDKPAKASVQVKTGDTIEIQFGSRNVKVEVLDVKPLGGHVCIDVVLTTAASIPLIEARRRARVERQQKAQTYMDADYGE